MKQPATQCKAITRKGHRCPIMHRNPNGYCTNHGRALATNGPTLPLYPAGPSLLGYRDWQLA